MTWYNPMSWFDPGEPFTAEPDPDKWDPGSVVTPVNPGTTHSRPDARLDEIAKANGDWTGYDERNYMYGRDPGAADAAVNKAYGSGENAKVFGNQIIGAGQTAGAVGVNMLNRGNEAASAFNNRGAIQGDFGAQNQSLGQLGGLEAQEGPSAAQAQLQSGTNQALNSQLALARSGRGFGGNAAAMGQAQGNVADIQANAANQAAMLRAQENANWRGRQASNLGQVAGMQGQQAQSNLSAGLQSRGQNDAMFANQTAMGQDAYFQGQGVQMGAFGMGQHALDQDLASQGLADQIRGKEMQGGQTQEDQILRAWAAKNGFNLGSQQAQDQKNAGYLQAGATALGAML